MCQERAKAALETLRKVTFIAFEGKVARMPNHLAIAYHRPALKGWNCKAGIPRWMLSVLLIVPVVNCFF